MLAALVDTTALIKVVVYSLVVGIGVTVAFSFSILGATRFSEMRRDGRIVAASVFALVSVVGLMASLGAIVLGILELTSK